MRLTTGIPACKRPAKRTKGTEMGEGNPVSTAIVSAGMVARIQWPSPMSGIIKDSADAIQRSARFGRAEEKQK